MKIVHAILILCAGGALALACGGDDEEVAPGKSTGGFGGTNTGGNGGSAASGGGGTAGMSGGAGTGGHAGAGGLAGSAGDGGSLDGGDSGVPPEFQKGSVNIAAGAWNDGASKPHCEQVNFPKPFTADPASLNVHVSLSHPGSSGTHQGTSIWVEQIDQNGFQTCMTELNTYDNNHAPCRVDWIAYDVKGGSQYGFQAGEKIVFDGTGVRCGKETFPVPFQSAPNVQLSVNYRVSPVHPNDPITIWAEAITQNDFVYCAQELGQGDNTVAFATMSWIAYESVASFPAGFAAGEHDFAAWNGTIASCEAVTTPCTTPSCYQNVQLSINHRSTTMANPHNPTTVWAEGVDTNGDLRVCVSELIANGTGGHDAELLVNWLLHDGTGTAADGGVTDAAGQ